MNPVRKLFKGLACFFVFILLLGTMAPFALAGDKDAAKKCRFLYSQKKYKEAFPYCKRAAENGDAEAQLRLGGMYAFGEGVRKDFAKAMKWYRKAAEQGIAGAQNSLGVMYFLGHGVKKDYTEAFKGA